MTTTYCDLDGVLASFIDGAIEAADLPLTHDEVVQWNFFKPYMSVTEFWDRIHAQSCFWEDLPVYPWAHELVGALRSFGDVIFCSDPSHDDEAASGKIKWLKRHGFVTKGDPDCYVLLRDKFLLSKPGTVLVDDSTYNCAMFRGAAGDTGGHAIVFPQRWNDSLGHATLDPVGAVIGHLKAIRGLGKDL